MSRPSSSHRPNHIPLPPSNANESTSPLGSPRMPGSPTSPRSSFLPSFMRTRSRTVTQPTRPGGATSPTNENARSRDPSTGPPATAHPTAAVTRSVSTPVTGGLANTAAAAPPAPTVPLSNKPGEQKTHRIRLVPHLETSRSLAFEPVVRELLPIILPPGVNPSAAAASITEIGQTVNGRPPALLLKVGRFTDKPTNPPAGGDGASSSRNGPAPSLAMAGGGGDLCSGKVAFKSKVVSRSHAEIWCEAGGKFFIRDTASSSGTFLNHIRLSSPNTESRPTALNDGDVLQLGVDYQGGQEDMFRCVKMRVELGREWQRAANEFNTNALKQLKALGGDVKGKSVESPLSPSKRKASVTDCCICLFSVTVCQSLFIAPCSHVFHYKCIRPLLQQHYPGFSCPLCRTFANLEEDVETEDAWEIASRRVSVISRRPSNHSIRLPNTGDGAAQAPGSEAPPGDPFTGVGFGSAAASVEELLAPESRGESTDENIMVDDQNVNIEGSDPLQRSITVVQDHANQQEDVDMPDPVPEEDEDAAQQGEQLGEGSLAQNSTTLAEPVGTTSPVSATSFIPPPNPGGVAIPLTTTYDPGPMSLDQQTPRNDTFLATLAPGMLQRLDLAGQLHTEGEPLPEIREGEELTGPSNDMTEHLIDEGSSTGHSGGARTQQAESTAVAHSSGTGDERVEDDWVQFDAEEETRRANTDSMFS